MTQDAATSEDAVEFVMLGSYNLTNGETFDQAIKRTINEHIAKGWTLFNVSVAGGDKYHDAYITFIK